jgi:hypothetical protein
MALSFSVVLSLLALLVAFALARPDAQHPRHHAFDMTGQGSTGNNWAPSTLNRLHSAFGSWMGRFGRQIFHERSEAEAHFDVFTANAVEVSEFNKAVKSTPSDGPVPQLSLTGPFAGLTLAVCDPLLRPLGAL